MKHKNFYRKKINELEKLSLRQEEEIGLLQRMNMKKDYLIQGLEREIQLSKTTDILTDTYNKQFLTKKFREAVNMHKRWGFTISLCYFDLDNLNVVNETYGSDYGDSLLMSFSKLTKYLIRDELDSLFRIGGDEFLVILIDCSKTNALGICQRINKEYNCITEGHSLSYSVIELQDTKEYSLEDHLNMIKNNLKENKLIN